jgi:hypothetical protein
LENAVACVPLSLTIQFFVPDRLDMLDSAATLGLFSRPAWVYLAERAGRIMQQADFIDSALKPGDVTNG